MLSATLGGAGGESFSSTRRAPAGPLAVSLTVAPRGSLRTAMREARARCARSALPYQVFCLHNGLMPLDDAPWAVRSVPGPLGAGRSGHTAVLQFMSGPALAPGRSKGLEQHMRSVRQYAALHGYSFVLRRFCPYPTVEAQLDALYAGLPPSLRQRQQRPHPAVDDFMQRVLATEHMLQHGMPPGQRQGRGQGRAERVVPHVLLQLDTDVRVRDQSRAVAGVLAAATRSLRGFAPSTGRLNQQCHFVADFSPRTGQANAGVFVLRRGRVALELLREWRRSYARLGRGWNFDQGCLMDALLRLGSRYLGQEYDNSCSSDNCAKAWLQDKLGLRRGAYAMGPLCLLDQTVPEQKHILGNVHDDCSVRTCGCCYEPGDFVQHAK